MLLIWIQVWPRPEGLELQRDPPGGAAPGGFEGGYLVILLILLQTQPRSETWTQRFSFLSSQALFNIIWGITEGWKTRGLLQLLLLSIYQPLELGTTITGLTYRSRQTSPSNLTCTSLGCGRRKTCLQVHLDCTATVPIFHQFQKWDLWEVDLRFWEKMRWRLGIWLLLVLIT